MDPSAVKQAIGVLVKMREEGTLPKQDFYLREIQGPASLRYDVSLSSYVLAGAINALGSQRLPNRHWEYKPLVKGLDALITNKATSDARTRKRPGQNST